MRVLLTYYHLYAIIAHRGDETMKKKTKTTALQGNLNETYIVQKSEPLLLMRTVPFELGELKILDTYLSRINSHDEECKTVTFTKAEYEKLMGMTQTRVETLKKYTKSMLQKVVEVPMSDGFRQFTLFTCADYKKDEYGQWTIKLSCSDQAQELFFNIEQLGYLKYEIQNILSLTSKYSFLLYLYLRKERYRVDWTIPLQELREQKLDIKNNETYLNFKYFKRDILEKSVSEINEKTDIKFIYEPIKTGRQISAIKFKLIKQDVSFSQEMQGQISFSESESDDDKESQYSSELVGFLAGACDYEFSDSEMIILKDLIIKLVPSNKGTERYDYLLQKYHLLKHYHEKKPIKNKFNYLKSMLEKEFNQYKGG